MHRLYARVKLSVRTYLRMCCCTACACTCTCVCMYMYVHMYVHRDDARHREWYLLLMIKSTYEKMFVPCEYVLNTSCDVQSASVKLMCSYARTPLLLPAVSVSAACTLTLLFIPVPAPAISLYLLLLIFLYCQRFQKSFEYNFLKKYFYQKRLHSF